MEVYESHLGGLYFLDEVLDWDSLYCEQCGDTDWHLGHADTWQEVLGLITEIDEDDGDEWCHYSPEYLDELKPRFEAWLDPKE